MKINGLTPKQTSDPRIFLLPSAPNPPESLQLFRNGILQQPAEQFGLVGAQIVYHFDVDVSDRQLAWFETESR